MERKIRDPEYIRLGRRIAQMCVRNAEDGQLAIDAMRYAQALVQQAVEGDGEGASAPAEPECAAG